MVHQRVRRLRGHVWGADQVKNGQMLGIGPGNGIDGAEFADAVGGADRADAFDAGVAVRRVTGIQLVATTNPAHVGIIANRVVNRERIVAGNTEDIGDADIVKSRKDVLNNGLVHVITRYGLGGWGRSLRSFSMELGA